MRQMWMGPRGFETWVPMPAIDMPRSRVGYANEQRLLNGGISVVRSGASSGEWQMTWRNKSIAALAPIEAMAAGLYDTRDGSNPIYFIDPSAAASNVLSPDWAAPGMPDAVPLVVDKPPTLSMTGPSDLLYPARVATYSPRTGDATRTFYLPIPPGHDVVLGGVGTRTGNAMLTMRGVTPSGSMPAVELPLQATPQGVPFTERFSATDGLRGVELGIAGTSGSVAIRALMARVIPAGASIPSTSFMPGRGHAGCAFTQAPSESLLSAALDMSTFTARLVEVEPWQ